MAIITRGELQDSHYFFSDKKEEIQSMAISSYLKAVKLVGIDDTIMITPMKRNNIISTTSFNKMIQDKLITNKSVFIENKYYRFYIGDKVIQRENDYVGKEVINGETGYIKEILSDRFIVRFIDRDVEYINDDVRQIDLAYCITGHKYQGSQAKIVIIVFHTSNYIMLSRQWLYTASTRSTEQDFKITSRKAFALAVSTDHAKRRTFLQQIIKDDENI